MKSSKFIKSGVLVFTSLFLFHCSGPKERMAESVLDTPENHYLQGVKYLNNNDLTNAEREFNLSKGLKNDFAPAYEGLAIVGACTDVAAITANNKIVVSVTVHVPGIGDRLSEDVDYGGIWSREGQPNRGDRGCGRAKSQTI